METSGPTALTDDEAVAFGRLYRRAASDLNQAQTFVSGESTIRYLNDLVARAYLAIYGKDRLRLLTALVWLVRSYPAIFRRHLPQLGLATAVCFVGVVLGYLASRYDSAVGRVHLLPADFPMIQPREGGEEGLTERQTRGQLAAFSSFLFTNNLQVTLIAFGFGMLLGIPTLWFMFHNGVMLGALAAVFEEANQWRAFATGVLPHGVIELPAMLIGGGAGLVLAQAMLRARPWPRREELALRGERGTVVVIGQRAALDRRGHHRSGSGCAPDWYISSGVKLAVASIVGLAFAAYLCLGGWSRRAA